MPSAVNVVEIASAQFLLLEAFSKSGMAAAAMAQTAVRSILLRLRICAVFRGRDGTRAAGRSIDSPWTVLALPTPLHRYQGVREDSLTMSNKAANASNATTSRYASENKSRCPCRAHGHVLAPSNNFRTWRLPNSKRTLLEKSRCGRRHIVACTSTDRECHHQPSV